LFYDEVASFNQLDEGFKEACYLLLHNKPGFGAFFDFLNYKIPVTSTEVRIRERFGELICEKADLHQMITDQPVALAYCLALIHADSRYSITPKWVIKNYPEVERIMFRLRNQPCLSECSYCNQMLDAHGGVKKYFGFDTFRTYGGEPLQEKAVKAAIDNRSILAVFPTGGGKSVDGAWNTKNGLVEYQGVRTGSREQLFRVGPLEDGTNNIVEFLGIVHALAYCKQRSLTLPIYSDSVNAINWVKDKEVRTKHPRSKNNVKLFELVDRAANWLNENEYENKILKWETKAWGENPADFGRK